MHLVAPSGVQELFKTNDQEGEKPSSLRYEKYAITARAKSALKFGANVMRIPPAVAALTIAAAILVIFAIPSKPAGKANALRKTSYHPTES